MDIRLLFSLALGELNADNDFEFYGVSPNFVLSKHFRPNIRGWGALANAVRTRSAVLEGEKPDLIYAREVWALSLIANVGIPFVFESHWLPVNVIQRMAEVRLLRSPLLRRVVFISESLRTMYLDLFPWLSQAKTLVAHDAATVCNPDLNQSNVSTQGASAFQVGYVGSFQIGCGVDVIVEIAKLLPAVHFHVFGGQPAEVKNWSERTSEVGNLRFHGFVPPSRLPNIYCSLDVVLAPYQPSTRSIQWASPDEDFRVYGPPESDRMFRFSSVQRGP